MRTVAEPPKCARSFRLVLLPSPAAFAPGARRSELRAPLGDLSPGGGPGSEGGSEELLGSASGAQICERSSDLRGEIRSPKRSSEGGSEELLDLGVPLGGEAEPAQVGAVARGEELHGALQRGLECRHLVHRV